MDEAKDTITRGTGNVFADLGYADAEERQTKLRLAHAINDVIARRRLTQAAAAEKLEINQPKVSALASYKLDGFSVERLMTFPSLLNQDVVIRNKHACQWTPSLAQARSGPSNRRRYRNHIRARPPFASEVRVRASAIFGTGRLARACPCVHRGGPRHASRCDGWRAHPAQREPERVVPRGTAFAW
jgi:predicted XRE-type DNA-binding protein